MSGAGEYVIVWEFRVRQAREAEFIQKYGPDGAWARFFRGAPDNMSPGYIRTELVRDVATDFRYLTLDYWKSEEEFKRFREQNVAEYERLDKEFEGLTESETRLGAFWRSNVS